MPDWRVCVGLSSLTNHISLSSYIDLELIGHGTCVGNIFVLASICSLLQLTSRLLNSMSLYFQSFLMTPSMSFCSQLSFLGDPKSPKFTYLINDMSGSPASVVSSRCSSTFCLRQYDRRARALLVRINLRSVLKARLCLRSLETSRECSKCFTPSMSPFRLLCLSFGNLPHVQAWIKMKLDLIERGLELRLLCYMAYFLLRLYSPAVRYRVDTSDA